MGSTRRQSLEFTHGAMERRQIKNVRAFVWTRILKAGETKAADCLLYDTSETSKAHWQSVAETGVCSGYTKLQRITVSIIYRLGVYMGVRAMSGVLSVWACQALINPTSITDKVWCSDPILEIPEAISNYFLDPAPRSDRWDGDQHLKKVTSLMMWGDPRCNTAFCGTYPVICFKEK